jgi:uncharacterized FlaG/YvyC family protein
MKTLILNHYANTILAKNSEEAVNFINSLNGITANNYTISILEDYFTLGGSKIQDIWKRGMAFEIATTGCGSSRIMCYKPLASTLEKHNEIILQRKQEQEQEQAKKRAEREQEYLAEMYEDLKGWYIVTITGLAFKLRGNDGKVTKSVKVLANNKMQAYNLAVKYLEENPPKNVTHFYSFESSKSTLIEYVGIWTDEAQEIYN